MKYTVVNRNLNHNLCDTCTLNIDVLLDNILDNIHVKHAVYISNYIINNTIGDINLQTK